MKPIRYLLVFAALATFLSPMLYRAQAGPVGGVIITRAGGTSITTAQIADQAVTTNKIADGAVTTPKLGAMAVTSAKVANGAIGTAQLGAMSVDTAQLANGAVTTAQLANGAVTQTKIGTGEVTASALAANAVTTPSIQATAVGWAQLHMFRSTVVTGSGSAQNTAHGLGVTPAWCQAIVEDTASTVNYAVAEGSHTSTNCIFTVTSTVKYRVLAVVP